jgi:hypothetical protein
LLTQKRLGGDKDACSKLLTALAKTRHESARQHFILKVDGTQQTISASACSCHCRPSDSIDQATTMLQPSCSIWDRFALLLWSGLQVINATIKKFVLVDSGVDEAFAQTVMDVLNSMSLIINSNVAAFRTNCTIGTTLGDLAKAAVCSWQQFVAFWLNFLRLKLRIEREIFSVVFLFSVTKCPQARCLAVCSNWILDGAGWEGLTGAESFVRQVRRWD